MENDIINNSEVTKQVPPTPTPDKNIFKTLFFIFLGLFIVVLSILIYSLISFTKPYVQPQSKTPEIVISTPVPTSDPTPTVTSDNTQDWKTYTNPTYNYSVKYPNIWNLQPQSIYKNEISFRVPEISCDHNIFCFTSLTDYQDTNNQNSGQNKIINSSSLLDYLTNSNESWKFINKTTTTSQTFYEVTSIDMVKATSFFIENNQKKFFCRIDLCSEKTSLDDVFISTFKFN